MIDLAAKRAALIAEVAVFKKDCMDLWFVPDLAASYTNRDFFSYSIIEDNQVFFMIEQARQLWTYWNKAKAQAVPVWISTDFMLPDEDEAVLFMDKNNVIHDGYLSTDYVDGPYGENGEDFGDNQTLWASNSNGDEFLLNKVKYWMHRPSNPITGGSGAEQ